MIEIGVGPWVWFDGFPGISTVSMYGEFSSPAIAICFASAMAKYVCCAISYVKGLAARFVALKVMVRFLPIVTVCLAWNDASGRYCFDRSFSVSRNVMVISPFCDWETDSTCHFEIRAKPCAGASGSSCLSQNHGKQIGTPPRIAFSDWKRLDLLRKMTGCWPMGW